MRDRGEFDEFYASTAARVVTHLYAMIGDLAEAEDAVQEAYARAWQRWHQVGAYRDPVGWVRMVAYRIAVSSWRRTRTRWAAQQRSRPPEHAPELSPDTVALVAALRQISAEQREAIVLHHLLGLTVEEVQELRRQGYVPYEYYLQHEPIRRALDLITIGEFSPDDPGRFRPIVDSLLREWVARKTF